MSIIAGLFAATFGRLLGKRRGPWPPEPGSPFTPCWWGRRRQWCGRRQDGLNSLAFVAAVMVVGGLAVLGGVAWAPLGWLAWPFVAYTIRVVGLFALVQGGVIHLGQVALPAVILC